ncbi:probable RNA-binding protein EIF1AD [Spodoptera frugiperda]|uniref:Probable RNA-binding protein EIF1AD n=1 Tax=Spodoptera frugiperda TaxID=7108 RepID=A0A9R0ELB9_SPOFR|nr:probable RNA-binding protein EIF1AD [Spodoptera frugiperda]
MSRVTRRKHVMNENTWDDDELPKENQSIVKVTKNRGNNLHAVINPSGEEFLVSMPTKFRKNIWVRRGSFIVVEPIPEGDKVKAEIVKVLNKDSIKYYKEQNVWPKEFDDTQGDMSDDELFANCNRDPAYCNSDTDSEDDDDDDSSDLMSETDSGNDSGDTRTR